MPTWALIRSAAITRISSELETGQTGYERNAGHQLNYLRYHRHHCRAQCYHSAENSCDHPPRDRLRHLHVLTLSLATIVNTHFGLKSSTKPYPSLLTPRRHMAEAESLSPLFGGYDQWHDFSGAYYRRHRFTPSISPSTSPLPFYHDDQHLPSYAGLAYIPARAAWMEMPKPDFRPG
ncbi:uncharacterized protein Z518_10930 [Rhinocladiella mackenziei CBS 650.93]|uniref:Uncharacterized protein n=1 Tax=Rhinocladiella mackenziei CBS 650.93 TaxID=1442369 RepID=A0A0D2GNV3_9EURO|nr:uncharacterized protein Z518_10930 [Rhinocladiella mackenziei CBS 650.93]KIX00003.1 hypothetical protein Z518_10930 [Rhinocladiella mackenziei CBS 650.93]